MFRALIASLFFVALSPIFAHAHCQIPCGIYGDETRFTLIEEHITTIEKSMKKIEELGTAEKADYNQIVRWVENKEDHADQIADIVTAYFLQQRVKPVNSPDAADYGKYVEQVNLCHRLLIHSMKAKQSTDLAQIEKLRTLLHDFAHVYMGKDGHKH